MTNNKFKSKWGYILASVGSAVGMANIWGFPYKLGENGGFAFLIPYLIFIVLFSYVALTAEFTAGRKYKMGVLGTYESAWKSRGYKKIGNLLGWIPLIAIFLLSIGYAVIIAYILKALIISFTGEIMTIDTNTWFESFAFTDFSVVPLHIIVIIVSLLTLIFGVKSIEKTNKIMMPIFFILFIIMGVRVFLLPNAIYGYEFLFVPNWESLLDPIIWIKAMGQAFFSLSVVGSGMIVYGSYIEDNENLISGAAYTGLFDTIASMVAALVLIPAIFSFGVSPSQGPSMLFITIPAITQQMPFGRLFAIVLFIAVLFGGISSIQNMFETVIQSLLSKYKKLKRIPIIIILALVSFLIGLNMESIEKWGPWMDIVSIYILPLGATIGAITWFWIMKKNDLLEELNKGRNNKNTNNWYIIGKYIYVPIVVILTLYAVVNGISF